MTAQELRLHRMALLMSVSQAARLVGKCSDRAWRYWEDGGREVPADVADNIRGLISYRNAIIRGEAEEAKDEIGVIVRDSVRAARLGNT